MRVITPSGRRGLLQLLDEIERDIKRVLVSGRESNSVARETHLNDALAKIIRARRELDAAE